MFHEREFNFKLELIESSGKTLGSREITVTAYNDEEATKQAWTEAISSLTTHYSYKMILLNSRVKL